jgi:hypothetical protein
LPTGEGLKEGEEKWIIIKYGEEWYLGINWEIVAQLNRFILMLKKIEQSVKN